MIIKVYPKNREDGNVKEPMIKNIVTYTEWMERAFNRGYKVQYRLDKATNKVSIYATDEREKNDFIVEVE